MNLFILDLNPKISAQYHVDKHIVKMPTETAQMISFIYHSEFWESEIPDFIMNFSRSHYAHPCTIWMRESLSNFIYSCQIGIELYQEYQYRYNQPDKHKRAISIFEFAINNPPNLPNLGLTKFAQAMEPDFIQTPCPIENYRMYYRIAKKHLHRWTKREKPQFCWKFCFLE